MADETPTHDSAPHPPTEAEAADLGRPADANDSAVAKVEHAVEELRDALEEFHDTVGVLPALPALPRCDCPALPVPHVHQQSGPVPMPEWS